jgi:HIRAN domain
MPFWSRRKLAPPNVAPGWSSGIEWQRWPSPRNHVAGESHRQNELEALVGEPRSGGRCVAVEVLLVREPENPFDENAVRAEIQGTTVGYLRRLIAAQLAGPLDSAGCGAFGVCGVIRGGSPQAPNYGVHVWLNLRTTPGPEISQADDIGEVSWPPHEDELAR